MDEIATTRTQHALRLSLLATGAGLLWAAFSLFTPTDAHAQGPEDDASGLIGIVSGVTGGAVDLVGSVTETVGVVAPPVAPVTEAVSDTVTRVADVATVSVPQAVPPVASIVEPVVTDVVQPAVDVVVQPVLDTVTTVTAPIPVVGGVVSGVVEAVDLPATVGHLPEVVEIIDTIVGSVTPTPTGSIPVLPGAGSADPADAFASIPGAEDGTPGGGGSSDAARGEPRGGSLPTVPGALAPATPAATPSALSLGGPPLEAAPRGPVPGDAVPPGPAGANSAGASSPVVLHARSFRVAAPESSYRSHHASDELPACPVFETDISPD